jgi:hypothetical protein
MNVNAKLDMLLQLIENGLLTTDQAYNMFLTDNNFGAYPELKMETIEMDLP